MDADNWTICPRCKAEKEKKNKTALADLNKKYGKIPADEFVNLRNQVQRELYATPEATLQENWSIGVSAVQENFTVNYRSSCDVCKFSFKFKQEEKITI